MFCADTSSWIPYLAGQTGPDVELIETHLTTRTITMCPVVLAELISDPLRSAAARRSLLKLPILELQEGFWERAGLTRAELVRHNIKPKLADTLIAQFCLDHAILLHTRDHDFRAFAQHVGLRIVLHSGVS